MSETTQDMDLGMSLSEYWQILTRRLPGALILLALALAVAGWYAYSLPAVYWSQGTILVDREEVPEDIAETMLTGIVQERIEKIRQRALTRARLIDMAQRHKLSLVGFESYTQDEFIDDMRGRLSVALVDVDSGRTGRNQGRIVVAFTIGFAASTPEKAQVVVAELMDVFLAENQKLRLEVTEAVVAFLDGDAERLRLEIGGTEQRIAKFRQANEGALPEQIVENRRLLRGAIEERLDSQNRVQTLRLQRAELNSQLALLDPHFGTGSNSGRELSPSAQLVQARLDLAEAREKYSLIHPEINRLNLLITALEKEVTAPSRGGRGSLDALAPTNPDYINAVSRLTSIDSDLATVATRVRRLTASIGNLRESVNQGPLIESELQSLQAVLGGARQESRDIREKQTAARLALQLERDQKGGTFSVVERASLPSTPISPDRLGIAILGALVGLFLGLIWVLFAEYNDRSIRGKRGLLRAVGMSPIAVIPELSTA